jgi:hypothetical protein
VVFEATVDRERLIAALRVVRALRFLVPVPSDFLARRFRASFTAKDRLTHRVDAREYAACKRAALAAHASQASGLEEQRTLAWLLRLPRPLFRQALGAEWFVERHRDVGSPAVDDVFRPLRRGLARLRT